MPKSSPEAQHVAFLASYNRALALALALALACWQ
jgi:hypothetical protein